MRTTRRKPGAMRSGLAVLCAALLALAVSASPAFADRSYSCQITASASPSATECNSTGNTVPGGAFLQPYGLAVDGSHNLWVADAHGGGKVDKFDSSGNFLAQSTGTSWSGNYIYGIAFSNSSSHLYVADSNADDVWVLNSNGSYLGAGGDIKGPWGSGCCYIFDAVDNSGGATAGDVYVSSSGGHTATRITGTGTAANFSASAPYISGNILTGTPAHSFGTLWGVATDPSGNVYVVDQGNKEVDEFQPSGAFVQAFTGAAAGGFGSLTGVAVDPTNGDVEIVDEGKHVVDEFDSSGGFLDQLTGAATPALSFGDLRGGIAADSNGQIYVSDAGNKVVDVFGPNVPLPIATYQPLSNQTPTSVTLNATIDPNGAGNVTDCYFEYGTSSAYGSPHIPCSPAAPYSSPTPVSADLSGLTVETTYHYRVVAVDANGTKHGSDQTYTPHAVAGVTTLAATNLAPLSATLNGSFVGNGDGTHCYFDWGTTNAYGHQTAIPPGDSAGSPVGLHTVSFDLGGLSLVTTYHYRIVCTNSAGTTTGGDQSFSTTAAVPFLTTLAATNVAPLSATLNGSFVGTGGHTDCYFDWGTTNAYGNQTAVPPGDSAGSPVGPGATTVSFNLSGLVALTTYHYRIVCHNSFGTTTAGDHSFQTLPSPPTISGETVTEVHSDGATLRAQINPQKADTTYHFEYGAADCSSNPCTSVPASEVDIGSGATPQSASAQLTGLSPGTTYHFRVVATNVTSPVGGTPGTDTTFTTFPYTPPLNDPCPNALARQQTGAALLPDCRAYELVSAPDTGGYDVESNLVSGQTPFGGYPQADSKVLYGVHNGAIPGTGNPTNHGIDPYVATRGANGWSTSYVGIPADSAPSSPPFGSPLLAADPSLDTFAFGGAGICAPCFGDGSTGIPVRMPDASLAQGMAGTWDQGASSTPDGLIAKPFSADGSHLVFGSVLPFEPDGNNNGDVSIYDRNLKTGITHVVSKTPGGLNLSCIAGAGTCHSPGNTAGISELDISANGSRIVVGQLVSTDAAGNHYYHLYMNVGDSSLTIDLTPATTTGALYDGMSSDGTKVYFSTKDKLTGDDHDTSADIYVMDLSDPQNPQLSRVSTGASAGDTNACTPDSGWNAVGGGSNCDAVAIGGGGGVAAGDGTIYFLSPEQLDGSGAQNEPNLFVERPGSSPHFVATLETTNPAVVDALSSAGTRHTADFQLTPSGDFAAFATTQALDANYDNAGHSEVYRYDAPGDALDCASCNSTGAQAAGDASLASNGLSLTDDGRVFFNSTDPLVLRDTDNKQDVYEWETPGTGDCVAGSEDPNYFAATNRCLSLISTGSSPFASSLLSASADGTDAYFFTHDTLVGSDHNGDRVKVYDAREKGGFFAVPPPPPCAASDECHGAGSSSPGPPNIGSGSGSGGNATPPAPTKTCKAGFVKKQGQCVRKPHHKKRRHHKRANANRGGAK